MLQGESTELQSISKDSLGQLRDWRNQEWLRKYFREYREINEFMQESWYESISQDNHQVNFEIRISGSNELIGHCGLYYINWIFRTAEFGIYIGNKNFRGQGFGKDALTTLLNYGFYQLNLNRIWCEVYSNNDSIYLYKKLGFLEEGTLREHYFCDGKYHNSIMMGLLKREWSNN